MILTACPQCGEAVELPDSRIGFIEECPQCHQKFQAQRPPSLAAPPPASAPSILTAAVQAQVGQSSSLVDRMNGMPDRPQRRYRRYPGGRFLYWFFSMVGVAAVLIGMGVAIDGASYPKDLGETAGGALLTGSGMTTLAFGWMIGYFSGREDREEFELAMARFRGDTVGP
jgi:hypothetical protein